MKIWKEVIRPGEYWYVDETTGQPAKMTATAADTKYWHDQGKAMLAAGLSIPVPLEHQTDAKPMTQAERVAKKLLNNGGWVEDYAIRHGDRLYALTNTDDKVVDPNRLPSTIKFTSPHINSFTDGDGKKWDGVVTHLALTSRPRIVRQEPFKTENAALSLVPAVPVPFAKTMTGVNLSLAGMLSKGKPLFSGAFSIWSGVKLDTTPFEPKEKEDKPPAKNGDKPPAAKDGEPPPKDGAKPDGAPPDGDEILEDMDMICVMCDLMSIYGMELGEGVTEENLAERMMAALTAKLKVDMASKTEPPPADDPAKPPQVGLPPKPAPVQESPPVFMSLEEIKKIQDPAVRATAERGFSLEQKVLGDTKTAFNRRVESLAKRLPAKARDRLLEQAKGAAFSMDGAGQVKNSMDDALALLEESVADIPSILLAAGAPIEQRHPEEWNGSISDKRAEEIADRMIADPDKKKSA
jgi:hypothetical protein